MSTTNVEKINRFESELKKVHRDGMDELLAYIRKSDMYIAPASSKFHLSVSGGLLQHSLNVLDALKGILNNNGDGTYSYYVAGKSVTTVTEDNVIISSLLHDLCKTNFYVATDRNRKNKNGNWETYKYYEIDDKMPLGHGEKSVMLLQNFIRLEKEEIYAIRWHMGMPEGDEKYTFNSAADIHPFVWAVHSADMIASHYMEEKEDNKEAYR